MPPSKLLSYCDAIIQELKEMCDYSLGKNNLSDNDNGNSYMLLCDNVDNCKDLLIEIIQEID